MDSDLSEQYDGVLITPLNTQAPADEVAEAESNENMSTPHPIALQDSLTIEAPHDAIGAVPRDNQPTTLSERSVIQGGIGHGGLEQDRAIFNHQYFMERLQIQIELRALEEEQFNNVLLESREEFDATDMMEKNNSAVLNLTTQKYSTVKIKKKRGELCCICIEHFSCNQEVYWLSCTHIFHNECLDEWVRYKNECPTCRSQLELKI